MLTMARAKKKATKAVEPVMKTHGVRMTGAYSDWLERFAESQRMSVATLIDRALAADAEQKGFEPPPRRVP
jgi:hypothetical protein